MLHVVAKFTRMDTAATIIFMSGSCGVYSRAATIQGTLPDVLEYSHYVIFANHVKTKFLLLYLHECQKIGGFYILVKHVQH